MDTIEGDSGRGLHAQSGEGDAGHPRLVQKRRQYSLAYKRQVVEEALSGGESVSIVARRHDINTNLLFTWRKRYLAGKYDAAEAFSLIPITVTPMAEVPASAREVKQRPSGADRLEIILSGGHRLVAEGAVDPAVLRTVLEILKA